MLGIFHPRFFQIYIGVINAFSLFYHKKHWILFTRPLWNHQSHISDTAILSRERCDETKNQTQLNRLQQLQNRAARVVAKAQFKDTDHRHAKLFQDLGWISIEHLIAY